MEKKRYQVSLTKSTAEEFQRIAKELRMPPGTMSVILDESLEKITMTMRRLVDKGSCTFTDLFQMIGEELDQIQKEVKADDAEKAPAGKKAQSRRKAA